MTSTLLIINLTSLAIASLAKGIYDAHEHAYVETPFSRWAISPSAWGRFWAGWSGPEAWKNKHKFENPILGYLFKGPLVFLTDLPHFAEFIRKSAIEFAIVVSFGSYLNLLEGQSALPSWSFILLWIAVLKVYKGAFFEMIYSLLRSAYTFPFRSKARLVRHSDRLFSIRSIQIVIVIFFTFAVLVSMAFNPPWNAPMTHPGVYIPLIIIILGVIVSWTLISNDTSR